MTFTSIWQFFDKRNAEERTIAKNESEGRYGLTEQDEENSRERVRTFNKIILQNLKSKLKIVSQSYQVIAGDSQYLRTTYNFVWQFVINSKVHYFR